MSSSDEQDRGLSGRAARGAAVTVSGQAIRVLLQFVGVIVLARLLSPEDFGLIAMATAFVALGELVRDFGLSNAAIQARTLGRDQRDALFWINTLIGVFLAGCLFFAAPLIASLFAAPSLVSVVQWLGLVLIINALSTQYRASLTRDMRFFGLTAGEIGAQAIGLASGITAAAVGLGVYALVVQQLAAAFVGLIWVIALSRWIPRFRLRVSGLRSFLHYGGNLLLSELLIYASKNVDTLVIGVRFDAASLGFYNRAYQLLMVPIMQINAPLKRVALPTLAKLQDDPSRYALYIGRAQKALVYVVLAILSFAAALADPLIIIVLGTAWTPVTPIFQVLALGGAFHVITYAVSWIFISRALTGAYLRYTLLVRSISIALVVLGVSFGVLGVAAGYTLGLIIQWPIALWWTRSVPGVPTRELFSNGVRALLVFSLASFAPLALATWVRPFDPLVMILVGAMTYLIAFSLIVLFSSAVRQDLRDVAALARRLH